MLQTKEIASYKLFTSKQCSCSELMISLKYEGKWIKEKEKH